MQQDHNKAIRIVLVDDHETMLWGLERMINAEPGMQVVGTAANPGHALERVAGLSPDIVLLDLDLGGSSSNEILPALVENGVTRALVLTGNRDPDVLLLAVRRGARGVLGKEASSELVLRAIRKVHQGELWLDQSMLTRVLGDLHGPRPLPRHDPEAARIASLTETERKIIGAMLDGGTSNKAIAQRIFIAEQTVRNHLTKIYHKLGVGGRLELYAYASKHQIGVAPV